MLLPPRSTFSSLFSIQQIEFFFKFNLYFFIYFEKKKLFLTIKFIKILHYCWGKVCMKELFIHIQKEIELECSFKVGFF